MELRIMDMGTLSAYTGFWKWQIRRHLKPAIFERLSAKQLQKYATAFDVTVDELKTMILHEGLTLNTCRLLIAKMGLP
jgi:hypothetical protein